MAQFYFMTCSRFISDLHLGHRNISKFRPVFESTEHNDQYFLELLNQTCTKRDITYFGGDIIFDRKHIPALMNVKGRKILIAGNHCTEYLKMHELCNVFDEVHATLKLHEFILSHVPIHESELRGKTNIHGHMHYQYIQDRRYMSMCPESTLCNFNLIDIGTIRKHKHSDAKYFEALTHENTLDAINSNPLTKKIYEETRIKAREILAKQ